jgi:hypothetical protein
MKKYIIKEKSISYGYRIVEAHNEEEALQIIPKTNNTIITDSGYYENLDIKELKKEQYLFCNNKEFNLVENKDKFVKNWEKRYNWKPCLEEL